MHPKDETFHATETFTTLADTLERHGSLLEDLCDIVAKMFPVILAKLALSLNNSGRDGGVSVKVAERALLALGELLALPKVRACFEIDYQPQVSYLQDHASLLGVCNTLSAALEDKGSEGSGQFLESHKKTVLLLFAKMDASAGDGMGDMSCTPIREKAGSVQKTIQQMALEHAEAIIAKNVSTLKPVAGGLRDGVWKAGLDPKANMKQINEQADKSLFEDKLISELDSAFRAAEKDPQPLHHASLSLDELVSE